MNGVASVLGTTTTPSTSTMSATPAQHDGPEVPEITTEELGFKALNGDKRARIAQAVWPEDSLPPPYASLLTIAPTHGIFATAGPGCLVIGETKTIRDRIWEKLESGNTIRDYEPFLAIPHSRVAHVAFTCDETVLIVAEESSQGCVAYRTPDLLAKKPNIALRIAMDAPLRAIAPNPEPSLANLTALLTVNGDLLFVNLSKGGELEQGPNGRVFASNASCVSWSNKGKQLLVGQADGRILQTRPDGSLVATVPRPASVPANCHVTQLSWLENNDFFVIYTPSNVKDAPPVSEYFMVTTDKLRSQFTFSRIPELVYAMVERYPACFYATRLKKWEPHLDDMLVISGTVGPDIAILAKSSKALGADAPTDSFVWASPLADSAKAALPFGESGNDTTPIGAAFDYSDQDGMINPIPGEEIERTERPLPELVVVSNEGMYNVWAVIYNDGIKQKTLASGFDLVNEIRQKHHESPDSMIHEESNGSAQKSSENTIPEATMADDKSTQLITSGFGQSASIFVGHNNHDLSSSSNKDSEKSSWTSSGFGATSTAQSSGFGQPAFGAPAFGAPAGMGGRSNPAFGKPSMFGNSASQAQTSPTFGQTGFGTTATSALGSKTNTSSSFGSGSAFGNINTSSSSPFGKASSGFGASAGQNAFTSMSKNDDSSSPFATKTAFDGSIFGKPSTSSPFAQATSSASPFGKLPPGTSGMFGSPSDASGFGKASKLGSLSGGTTSTTASPFGQKSSEMSLFGSSKPFSLGSTFTKDETLKEEDMGDEPVQNSNLGFGFGSDFSSTIKGSPAQVAASKEEDMNEAEIGDEAEHQATPPSTISVPKTITPAPHVRSVFGTMGEQSTTPQTQQKSNVFGGFASTTPKDTPAPSKFMFGTKPIDDVTPALVQKSEPSQITNPFIGLSRNGPDVDNTKEKEQPRQIDDAPLPPDFTLAKTPANANQPAALPRTSVSASRLEEGVEAEEAPLPPDFVPANKNAASNLTSEESGIPISVEDASDFEDSGEDVTGDLSSPNGAGKVEDEVDPVQTSPESSFGRTSEQSETESLTGGPFTKVVVDTSKPSKPLFGEVPLFAQPQPKPQESPRSPSPVRKAAPHTHMRSPRSPERSFSAPAHPRSILAQRKLEHQQSPLAVQAARLREEEIAKEKARLQAAQRAREEAEAAELQPLEDDEDEILRNELAKPAQPSPNLDPFMSITPGKTWTAIDDGRHDVASQIEKLYQDMNSMVVTVGINARSLTSYMLYQSESELGDQWPQVLTSDSPSDANELPFRVGDATRLPAGYTILNDLSQNMHVANVLGKLELCQSLLTQDITSLRSRITALRRSTEARTKVTNKANAPLSAEQYSIQQDLRKSSALVQSQLQQLEENLVVLRAKLSEFAPSKSDLSPVGGVHSSQARPTVEAVMNTISKMTAMAERKSADVDFLESQLRKFNMTGRPNTPDRQLQRTEPLTPESGGSSIYRTPESSKSRSVRGTPARSQQLVISTEDRERWKVKTKRKKAVASILRDVLQEKHKQLVK